ncbi:hypothetical protein [Candidatus Nitrosocosmicus oleophilus]|uniref:hypothetical protein n=1 Tax=Candidatus Nitrosocosmicus oleophilus TaxID=1353260 RepID=UPI001E3975D9|nr:hypothetical protein [Candidatus Nitrosocosmicus oleophilus]
MKFNTLIFRYLFLDISILLFLFSLTYSGLFTDKAEAKTGCNDTGTPIDKDADDIPDAWELYGLDLNNDSQMDLNLKSLGAKVDHKDLFLEIDYMKNHRPNDTSIQMIKDAFKNSPPCNPDNTTGINLHVIVDDEIPHQSYIHLVCQAGGKWDGFNSLKDKYFGLSNDANDSNKININSAKLMVYHYGIFIHQFTPLKNLKPFETRSGCANPSTLDFVVSLGEFDKAKLLNTNSTILKTDATTGDVKSNIYYESGTLMHELGHTLGLGHGGNLTDDNSYKPNYLSIMNYNFQFPSPVGNRPLDYSRCASLPLNEKSINESRGIVTTCLPSEANMSTWIGYHNLDHKKICPPDMPYVLNKSLDWDGKDNITSTKLIPINIDCDKVPTEVLTGYDDWKNIKYILTKSNFDRILPTEINRIFASSTDSTIDIVNSPADLNIYNEKSIPDLLLDHVVLSNNIVQTVNNLSESEGKNLLLTKLGESKSTTTYSIPRSAAAAISLTNDTGSFVVSNSTNISIPSNASNVLQIKNSTTNYFIPRSAAAAISLTNDTGSFVVSNSINIAVFSKSGDASNVLQIKNSTTNYFIPRSAAAGIVLTNDTGSFVVSNSTNIAISSNTAAGRVISNDTGSFVVSNSTNISIPSNASNVLHIKNSTTNISIPSSAAAAAGIVLTNDTGSFVVSNSINIAVSSNSSDASNVLQIKNSTTNYFIPRSAAAGIVLTNDTGSFVVSNSTNISIPENILSQAIADSSNLKDSLEAGEIDKVINILDFLEKSSDSSGDLIRDLAFQNKFNPQVNNLKSVLEKQLG